MRRRTPTKVRSRRESFRPDEIPTRDTPPSANHRHHASEPSTPTRPNNESSTLPRHRSGSTPALNDPRQGMPTYLQDEPRSNFRRAISLDFTSNSKNNGHQRRNSENCRLTWKSLIQPHPLIDELSEILPDDDSATDVQREVDHNNQSDEGESTETQDTEAAKPDENKFINNDSSTLKSNMAPGTTSTIGQAQSTSDFDSSDSKSTQMTKCIYQMWRNKQLCDVVFFVEDEREQFYAHKLILATKCDLFIEQGRELGLVELHFPRVRSFNMKQILKYFYTNVIEITLENVENVLEVSKQLRSNPLLKLCKDFLLTCVRMASSVRHRIIALEYGLDDVVTSIDSYIEKHFASLVNCDTFLQSDFRTVQNIISSDMLTSPDELHIFKACAEWINYDPDERIVYAIPLMSLIRFDRISPAIIVSQVEQVSLMINIPECKDMLYRAFRHHALFPDILNAVSRMTPRSAKSGRAAPRSTPRQWSPGSSSPSNPDDIPSFSTDTDVKETTIPNERDIDESKSNKSKAFINAFNKIRNTLRVQRKETDAGRKSVDPDPTTKQSLDQKPSESRKESERRKSKHIPAGSVQVLPLPGNSECRLKHRTYSDVIAKDKSSRRELHKTKSTPSHSRNPTDEQMGMSPILAGSEPFYSYWKPVCPPIIIALGGVNPYYKENDAEQINLTQSIQQYNADSNTWSVVSKMPKSLHHLAATMLGENLIITGGFKYCRNSEEMPSQDCFTYNVINGEWNQIKSLKTSRAHHVTVNLDDAVYVIGGVDCLQMELKSMECYDQEENEWFFTQPMKYPRLDMAAVSHRGKILVVGGKTDFEEKRLLNTVEVFDPSSGNWTSKSRFPLHIAGGSMVEVAGSIYFVGGFVYQDDIQLSIDSIFRYCHESDHWEAFQTLRVPRHGALVAAIGCRIYVIGGESSASLGHALTNVECIDVETNDHVTGIAPLLSPAYGIGGCSWN